VKREPQSELRQGPFPTFQVYSETLREEFRVGMYLENPKKPFKGCVLYLEGLADSILNHEPLFRRLSDAGYRTVSFDYLGQGGTSGTMNDTRIMSPAEKDYEVGTQAKWVWNLFSGDQFKMRKHNCRGSKRRIIGWSTGGLAGYKLAHESWAEEVVLIAPGLNVKAMVGEAADDWSRMYLFKDTITVRTLTRNHGGPNDPHVDPVKPKTPALIPLFAANLLSTSLESKNWQIPKNVRGFVFLSGKEDTYVDRDKIYGILRKNAPHFGIQVHDGSLHEMDNELPPVANDVRERTVRFFDN
jgi:pimeloyl-ACP methyl ester carboxylesterase